MKNLTLLFLLACISFNLRAYVPGNDRNIDADSIGVLNSTYVTLRDSVDLNSNDIFGINNLTVTGTTTLNVLLNGPLKATAGVVSSSAIDLASGEVAGTLPIANGGTNSNTALTNDKVMVSTAGSIVESLTTTTQLSYLDATSSIQTQLDGKEPTLPWTTSGDLLFYNVSPQRLGVGTEGQLLTVSSGLPSWQDAPISTTLDTKGQLQGFSTVNANVGPCTDDQILVYDSLEATGWKCSALPSTSPTTTLGDLIYNNTGTAAGDTRLGIGTEGQLLTVNSGVPAWLDAPVSTTLTTKGDIQTFDTANARLPVGNDGEFLVADSNETTGLKWSNSLSGTLNPMTNRENIALVTTDPGSVSSQDCSKKRLGDEVNIVCTIIFSGALTTNFIITNPETYSLTGQPSVRNGKATLQVTGQEIHGASFVGSGGISFNFLRQDSGNNNGFVLGSTYPQTIVSGDSLKFSITYKVADWSSGTDSVARNEKLIKAKFGDNTDQNIANNTPVTINLATKKYDTDSIVDLANNKIVIPKDGIYTFHPNIVLRNTVSTQPPANSRCFSGLSVIAGPNIGKTGTFGSNRLGTPPNTLWAYPCGSQTFEGEFLAGDEIQFTVEHNFGANVELVANDYVYLSENPSDFVIAGTFENINSTDLIEVVASGNGTEVLTDGVTNIPFIESHDPQNVWNGSEFTMPVGRSGIIHFSGGIIKTANSVRFISLYKDTGSGYFHFKNCSNRGPSEDIHKFECAAKLNGGDKLALRMNGGGGTLVNFGIYHHLVITENADYEAIVKNLSDNTIKCQTKLLSASVASDTADITDLKFQNLTIGKRYIQKIKIRMNNSVADQFDFSASQGGCLISTNPIGGSPSQYQECDFAATSTTLSYSTNGMAAGAQVFGNGSFSTSYVRLCELPDSHVETTEW